jgi:hypothetical protein
VRGPAFRLSQAQRLRDGQDHERWVVERRQGDESDAVREKVRSFLRRLYGEARLADSAHTREREQPRLRPAEEARYLLQVLLATHKGCGRQR